MSVRAVAGIGVLVVGVIAYWLERQDRRMASSALLICAGAALVLDDHLVGPFPGDWGLAGAAAIGLGVRGLLDRSPAARVRV